MAYLTKQGYDRKMQELAELEAQRPAIKAAIAEARDKGDLSENAEYDAAKEAQGMLEMKIAKLKDLVANGMTVTYTIVTESEANFRENKLASTTPIAAALIGHHVGDLVKCKVPAGEMTFEIIKIEI